MDFLKALFPKDGGSLTFDELVAKAKESNMSVVNLADGGYVSQNKFDDKVRTLNDQVSTLQDQIKQRNTDLENVKGQLATAQADAGKLNEVQKTLGDLQEKYNTDKTNYEQRISSQAYEFAVRERANSLKFSSAAAKKEFVREAVKMGFKQDGDTLMGFDDFITKYRTDDPGAFEAEKVAEPTQAAAAPKPEIVLPGHGTPPTKKRSSLTDLMKAKNDNPDLEINFDK